MSIPQFKAKLLTQKVLSFNIQRMGFIEFVRYSSVIPSLASVYENRRRLEEPVYRHAFGFDHGPLAVPIKPFGFFLFRNSGERIIGKAYFSQNVRVLHKGVEVVRGGGKEKVKKVKTDGKTKKQLVRPEPVCFVLLKDGEPFQIIGRHYVLDIRANVQSQEIETRMKSIPESAPEEELVAIAP